MLLIGNIRSVVLALMTLMALTDTMASAAQHKKQPSHEARKPKVEHARAQRENHQTRLKEHWRKPEPKRQRVEHKARPEARRIDGHKAGREKSFTASKHEARFANAKLRKDHFKDHRKEFGVHTERQYEQRAAHFMGGTTPKGVWQGTRPQSKDVVRYNPKTHEFGVISKDGHIRTYHKADPKTHKMGTNARYFEHSWRTEEKRREQAQVAQHTKRHDKR